MAAVMSKEEAIGYLEFLKWIRGFDNSMINGKSVQDIFDEIIALLKEQQTRIDVLESLRRIEQEGR